MPQFKFMLDDTKCMNCGICMDVCPFTCIEFTRPDDMRFHGTVYRDNPVDFSVEGEPKLWMMEKPYLPIQERCTGCQTCARECPTKAITITPDPEKTSLKPKPTIIKHEHPDVEDDMWHPLSYYTRDYLKRPVRSPWTQTSDWTPMTKERGLHQTWKTMETEE